jgi:hypothetical protein|nr:MAG TPA: major capsid protein [Caudoviricetes sp.]
MATYFDSKAFNPQAFGKYIDSIPNLNKNQLAKSGAVGANLNARNALNSQTGSLYARVPSFGHISAKTSQNNDGNTDIQTTSTTTFDQGYIVASRMVSWTERSFSTNITAGVNFMDHVAGEVASIYKPQLRQAILLAMLKGVFSMTTSGTKPHQKEAKLFMDNHVTDISANKDQTGFVGPSTLNSAIQKACGDNKNAFTLVIMHSAVATNLENQKLLEYMKYTDKDGIERQLNMATWNGRLVLVDDEMPTQEVTETDPHTKYTTYVLGNGALILDDIGDSVPYEMDRNPKVNGGEDTLYVRDRFICGVNGISFEKPSSVTASASDTDLSTGTNWEILHNEKEALSHKAIPIVKIVSRG